MQVGNARYLTAADFPETLPVFPLTGALLLPAGQLPLNIFEPRYLEMFDAALRSNRLIGMIQPALTEPYEIAHGVPALCSMGCIGRITSFAETGDGRYILSLAGICRFRMVEEVKTSHPFRTARISPFMADLASESQENSVDRDRLLEVFRAYLDANKLEADWDSVQRASNLTLVNSLSMMPPFTPAEKQALLEATDLHSRTETLIAITEIYLARGLNDADPVLQ